MKRELGVAEAYGRAMQGKIERRQCTCCSMYAAVTCLPFPRRGSHSRPFEGLLWRPPAAQCAASRPSPNPHEVEEGEDYTRIHNQ